MMIPQVLQLMSQRWNAIQKIKIVPSNVNNLRKHLQHRDQWGSLLLLPGNFLDPRVLHPSGKAEAPLPPPRPRCNFIHPKQLSPFPERLKLPFPGDEILSGFEDIVSSGTDQFTTWVKMDPDVTLGTTHGRCSKSRYRISRSIRKET